MSTTMHTIRRYAREGLSQPQAGQTALALIANLADDAIEQPPEQPAPEGGEGWYQLPALVERLVEALELARGLVRHSTKHCLRCLQGDCPTYSRIKQVDTMRAEIREMTTAAKGGPR